VQISSIEFDLASMIPQIKHRSTKKSPLNAQQQEMILKIQA
jgi:hypothetical protein